MKPTLRVLQNEFEFDDRLCECEPNADDLRYPGCELRDRRSTIVRAKRPANFNGLMIVVESPGPMEVRLGEPLLGPPGALVDRFLELVGVERQHTWITHATLCSPDWKAAAEKGKKKGFNDLYPNAPGSCAPRLFTEIEYARPRVILALGGGALHALLGRFEPVEEKSQINCTTCSGALTLPWWKCGVCKAANLLAPFTARDAVVHSIPCHACGWIPSETAGVVPFKTKKKCPTCDGKKTLVTKVERWLTDHSLHFVAGGAFRAQELGFPEGVEYVIPTYHPRELLQKIETKGDKARGGQFLAAAGLEHFKKAARLLVEDAAWEMAYRRITTVEEFDQYISEKTQYDRWTTVDIETDSKEEFEVNRIKCVGLHHENHAEAAVVVTEETLPDGSKRALHVNHPLVRRLCEWLADASQEKTLQNGIYDTQVIWAMWAVEVQGFTRDTKLAHAAVAPDEPHDLSHIAFTYTDVPPWKPPKKKGGIESFQSDDELHHYNATDCVATTRSMQHLEREMLKENVVYVHQLDIAKIHIARGMNRAGIPVDLERWNDRRSAIAKVEHDALLELRSLLGNPQFNPNSHQQLAGALFDPSGPFKLVPARWTETGAVSTDAIALAKHHEHPFVQKLFEYREACKTHSTIFGRLERDEKTGKIVQTTGLHVMADARVYFEWKADGARTGRWTSSPNAQNLAPEVRDVFCAPKGRKIVGADMAQAELRGVAALSGDEVMIDKCVNADENRKLEPEYDPHSFVASLAFPNFTTYRLDVPEEKAVRKALREVAKTVIYAANYGSGAETMWQGIYNKGYNGPPLSVEMVERVQRAIYRAFPRVKTFQDESVAKALATGYVRDALIGRMRVFPLGDVDVTVAKNYPIQATIASVMDMSLIELVAHLPAVDPTAKVIAQIHDAIYIECAEDKAEAVAALLEDCMSQELQLVEGAPFMPFPATAKIGDRMSEL